MARASARHRFCKRRQSFLPVTSGRRGGQALILAVFVMLFAALLSSTFLVIVASNTQSVARSVDKSGARHSADEGAQLARRLMASSADSDNWQPEAEPSLMGDLNGVLAPDELPPAPGDPTYDEYWTPLDKAMGWALTTPYTDSASAPSSVRLGTRLRDLQNVKRGGGHVFIKLPDPRFSREATRFMVESRLLTDRMDEVTDGGDKKFMLRVTTIGFSSENPEVWARQMLYKSTNLNGSPFSYANFVSNYDFTKKAFASTQLVADIPTGATTLDLKNGTSFGADTFAPGQTLMLSDGIGDPFTGIIARRSSSTVTLKNPVGRAFGAASTTVSLAATLTNGLDALNDSGARAALAPNDPAQNTLAPLHAEVNTVPAATTDTSAYGNGNFYNLGLKIGERAGFAARAPYARSWGTYRTYSGQNALTVTGPLDRSSANLLFYDAANPSAPALTPPPLSAEQNKYFRLSFTPQGAMQVDKYLPEVDPLVAPRPITPASIDLAFYQTRATNDGLRINNDSDFEKVANTELTNSQLQRLWQRKSFAVASGGNINYTGTGAPIAAGTTGTRLSFPRPGVDSYPYPMSGAALSLEQRGIRGWISPWEFLPRGALLELRGTRILVTADPLNDAGEIDPAKKVTLSGYSYDFPAPANGIVFASGNLRVRGNWTGAPLTIVSGHNLYIEGAVTAAPGKVALLAKNNVTLNPTQFMQRPAGLVDRHLAQTPVAISSQNGSDVTLVPGAIGRFKVGDAVALANSNQWVYVTSVSGDTLTLSNSLGAAPANARLRQMIDPELVEVDASGDVTTNPANAVFYAYALGQNSDELRRIALNDGGALQLGVRQAAQRVETTFTAISNKDKYNLRIKPNYNNNATIDTNASQSNQTLREMWIKGDIDNKTVATKGYFASSLHEMSPNVQGDANATLGQLQTVISSATVAGSGNGPAAPAWRLTLPGPTTGNNPYTTIPARRLAQFEQLNANSGTEFKVPLTTSVGLFWGNAQGVPMRSYGSFWGQVPVENAQNRPEDVATVRAAYYGGPPQWQALFDTGNSAPNAVFSLQRDVAGDPDALLPRHYFAGWHLEGGNGATTIAPVYSPTIQATIYAQSGSWFVIPLPAQPTDATNAQAGRWRRSFYKVSVEGNIAQGFTPSAAEDYDNEPDPDGVAVGATKRWLDALACPTDIVNSNGAVGHWQTISYRARPLPIDSGLALPSTAEVLYTFVE